MWNALKSMLPLAPVAVLALGCNDGNGTDIPPGEEDQLHRFTTCGGVEAYMAEVVLEHLVQSRYSYWYFDVAAEDADAPSDGGSDGPTDYTGTNNQEAGVDELDFVKTDGNHIYVVQNGRLYIVKSWPVEESSVVAELELDDHPHGLFVDGDRLVVFSYAYDEGMFRSYSGTRVTYVDISDRTAPQVTKTTTLEGWLADARMIDGEITLALNTWLPIPQEAWELLYDESLGLPETDWELTDEEREAQVDVAREILRPHVEALMEDHDIADFIPQYRPEAGADPQQLIGCTDLYRPCDVSQHGVLSIVQVDTDGSDLAATGILSDGWEVYASQDNFYVAQGSWWWWWGWSSLDMETRIHKFSLQGDDPEYVASGSVSGWTLNQFSFSEHDGALRVATTEVDWWWGTGESEEDETGSGVYVLEDDGAGSLVEVGSVTGIAPGEQIRGVRFQGERGFLVTFEQIDPLFTLDLSDKTDPKVVGELKMPGFSAYLHPMGPDHLLAVGYDGTDDGQITGLAVNVFDVTDFANPQLSHQYTIDTGDWSGSEAIWDHHAFTYHRDTLSIPAYIYDWDDASGYDYFSGLLVLDATPDGLSELGRVDHADLVAESECIYEEYWGYEDGTCDDWAWYAWMRRSIYIEDNVFSLSDYGIKVNDLRNPEVEIARVHFLPAE